MYVTSIGTLYHILSLHERNSKVDLIFTSKNEYISLITINLIRYVTTYLERIIRNKLQKKRRKSRNHRKYKEFINEK